MEKLTAEELKLQTMNDTNNPALINEGANPNGHIEEQKINEQNDNKFVILLDNNFCVGQ